MTFDNNVQLWQLAELTDKLNLKLNVAKTHACIRDPQAQTITNNALCEARELIEELSKHADSFPTTRKEAPGGAPGPFRRM